MCQTVVAIAVTTAGSAPSAPAPRNSGMNGSVGRDATGQRDLIVTTWTL